jgi:hypothetical protein
MMADALAPIAGRLAALLRLLSSDRDGEVLTAARKLVLTLCSAGSDIHALAARVEQPVVQLDEAAAKQIYDACFDDGYRKAENDRHGPGDFHNVDGTPCWPELAAWCSERGARLSEREREFIDDMCGWLLAREPTSKQAKWLLSIFYRLGGKRAR